MRGLALAALAFSASTAGATAELNVIAPVKDVTVYSDGAIVHRHGVVNLTPGPYVLHIAGVGASMVEQSLRAAGAGHIEIGAIEIQKMPKGEMNKDKIAVLAAKATEAKTRQEMAGVDLSALEKRKQFLEGLIESASKSAAQNLKALDLHQTLDVIEKDYSANGRTIVTKTLEVNTLKEETEKLDSELRAARFRQRDLYEVRIAVEATESGPATIDITYRVPDASWAAIYDMRLDTGARKITVTQDAAVTQDTGEDWNGIALTLTTARSAESAARFELSPIHVGLRPNVAPAMKNMAMAMAVAAPAPAAPLPSKPMDSGAQLPMATRKLATVQPGEFTTEFKIPGGVDLPNGIVEKRIPVAAESMDAKVELVGVPEYDNHPAIFASFVNGGSAALLSGKVGLYRDGTYIGVQALPAVAAGEHASLAFGADSAVSMKRSIDTNQHSETGTFTTDDVRAKSWTTTVKNSHSHPIEIAVLDRIPVSDDADLSVEPTGAAATPSHPSINGSGVFSNDLTIPAGGEKSLSMGFKAKWPKDHVITGGSL